MKIAIYSNDLTLENRHLMPWRTVLEVAAGINAARHQAFIFSGQSSDDSFRWNEDGVQVIGVKKPYTRARLEELISIFRSKRIDVIFWPLDWRGARLGVLGVEDAGATVIWYFPGACYSKRQILSALLYLPFKAVLPYILQALISRRRFVRRLKSAGVRPIITMTEYTRKKLIAAHYPSNMIRAIPPGKSEFASSNDLAVIFNHWREKNKNSPYFLFFGPPHAIRGIRQVLNAFQKVAKQNPEIRLVCLFRADAGLKPDTWQQRINKLKFNDRILCVWESVSLAELLAFLTNCYAVIKPFLIVPSEIPLAVIESAGFGKPVIGTIPGGTGDFIARFGLTVPPGCSCRLAQAMLDLLNSDKLYAEKCRAAKKVYADHPTWSYVAKQWIEMVKGA